MKNRNIVLLHYGGSKAVDLFVQRAVEVSVIAGLRFKNDMYSFRPRNNHHFSSCRPQNIVPN